MKHDHWYIEGYFSDNAVLSRLTLNKFPFKIGREADVDFVVPGNRASRSHAEFTKEGDRIFLLDKKSTNGTFVNRNKISEQTEVQHGDILHFADVEVRLIKLSVKKSSTPTVMQAAITAALPLSEHMPAGIRTLQE